ncbi:ribosome biogenesis factor YjgA [Desulfobacula toluolica]|uniref:Conserved uncharacterized protein, DUF615 n=1 Tax=Desulfobacula toluolica (strain DSM 7467 / Tol2) TaxID=651182 RepID=K0NSX1_DESTT|nr:ribosome biogenesis factor YjgA [Desulfobacula toluolica]CCK82097.1 conserved uncharacterized protein, DUF615 [Desulfobacula toluolica Tol2]
MEKDIQDKSRTQIKKEAEKLQKLGEQLIKLPIRQLERMELPDDLRDALIEARSIKSKIAGRRQRQFIGTLMRDVDPEPIRHALMQTDANLPIESEIVKKTRMWLDRLLTDDPAVMEEFICACPGLDHQRLRQLMRNVKKEKTTGKSSKSLKALEQLIMKSMNGK